VIESTNTNAKSDTLTLVELFPPVYENGVDLSLMSSAEWEIYVRFAQVRHALKEKYPNPRFNPQVEPSLQAEPDIDIPRARTDPRAPLYLDLLHKTKAIFDKIRVLQEKASLFEKYCLRWYWYLVHNWHTVSKKMDNMDVYEVTEVYFRIMIKYNFPVFEERYYFLTAQRKTDLHFDVEDRKRNTSFGDNEIHASILEAFL
jgi:hypothetical protein